MLLPSTTALNRIFGEDLLDGFFGEPFRGLRSYGYNEAGGLMKTDVKDLEDSYELSVSLPGVAKENIRAELKEGYLTISAATSGNNDEKDKNDRYIRRERYYGSASRSFYVGEEVSEEEIKAKYENGLLVLTVPKKDARQPEVEEKKYITIEG